MTDSRVTPQPDLDYEATDYTGLQIEIGDVFMGETGDLIREHAKAVLSLRACQPLQDALANVIQLAYCGLADSGHGCCSACNRTGFDRDGLCWDCRGIGHAHAPADDEQFARAVLLAAVPVGTGNVEATCSLCRNGKPSVTSGLCATCEAQAVAAAGMVGTGNPTQPRADD